MITLVIVGIIIGLLIFLLAIYLRNNEINNELNELELKKIKKRLLFLTLSFVFVNCLILNFGNIFWGNYGKSIPYGVMPFVFLFYGLILAPIFNFIPYRKLTYKKKFVLTFMGLNLIYNILLLLGILIIKYSD